MDHRPVDNREMSNIQGEDKERGRDQSEQREQRKGKPYHDRGNIEREVGINGGITVKWKRWAEIIQR